MLQELEVLVLDVLASAGWYALVGEQPVEVAGARPVEAQLHRRAGEPGEEPRLEVDLQVDHQIEVAAAELASRPQELTDGL